MIKFIYLIFTTGSFFAHCFSNEIPTILVSFDGMRYDYLNKVNTPNFDKFIDDGVIAESLMPIFPSLTFPNHYSIATGTYSDEHFISGNLFYSKVHNQKYSMYKRETVEDPKFYGGEPIWVTAEKQGVKTASYFWVGSEAPIKGIQPSIFKRYDAQVQYSSRVDSIISWLKLPIKKRPKLLMLYFNEPDKSGHIYGPNSLEVLNAIEIADKMVGKLVNGLNKNMINANIIILSDHGMREISRNKIIVLDDFYPEIKKHNVFGSGPLLQIDSKDNILNNLNNIPNLSVYRKNQIPQRYKFINENTCDYLVVSDPGWLVFTKESLSKTTMLDIKGMHGWDPLDKKMHGIFMAKGPSIYEGKVINTFENVLVNGIICKLLNILPYSSHQHKDGSIINNEVINKIVK